MRADEMRETTARWDSVCLRVLHSDMAKKIRTEDARINRSDDPRSIGEKSRTREKIARKKPIARKNTY
jgi:hypothetical protein